MHIAQATAKSSIPILEPDTYQARCVQFIDIGEQKNPQDGNTRRQCMLIFELPTERIKIKDKETGEEREMPRMMTGTYTLSMSEKSNLRKTINQWRGVALSDEEARRFDVSKLLNVPCMLSVVHKTSTKSGNAYATIGGVSKYPKSMPALPPAETPIFVFDLDTVDDLAAMEALPNWVQERIKQSPTYEKLLAEKEANDAFQNISVDDLPFGEDA